MIKNYKPTSPSLRHRKILIQPKKFTRIKNASLSLKNNAGRNNTGSITTRHHGGRNKRHYRNIDFLRNNAPYSLSSLLTIENDPNRSANIARYMSPLFKSYYIVAPEHISPKIQGPKYPFNRYVKNGDTLPLSDIPIGSKCYNIQTDSNKHPTLARSSGSAATLLKTDDHIATLRLPSKKIVHLDKFLLATVGQPSNANKNLTVKGKAGANR
jgi:large subunit ribosomal protein L2